MLEHITIEQFNKAAKLIKLDKKLQIINSTTFKKLLTEDQQKTMQSYSCAALFDFDRQELKISDCFFTDNSFVAIKITEENINILLPDLKVIIFEKALEIAMEQFERSLIVKQLNLMGIID